MKRQTKSNRFPDLLALVLLGLLAVSVLCVLLTGADAYRRLNALGQDAYERRTAVQYLNTKVRQSPGAHAVSVQPFGQGDALVIRRQVEGTDYLERIYCWDGWLMELFCAADSGLAPQDGEKLLPAHSLTLEQEGALVLARLEQGGAEMELTLYLPGGEEVRP